MAGPDYISVENLADWEEVTAAQLPEDLAHDVITAVSRSIDTMCWRQADGFGPAGNTAEQRMFVIEPDARRLIVDDFVEVTEVRIGSDTADPLDLDDLLTEPYDADRRGRPYEWIERLDRYPLAGSLGGYSRFESFGSAARSRMRAYVTARWGWPATPAEITQAVKIGSARLLGRKDVRFGLLQSDEFGSVELKAWDPDERRLICAGFKRKSHVGGQ